METDSTVLQTDWTVPLKPFVFDAIFSASYDKRSGTWLSIHKHNSDCCRSGTDQLNHKDTATDESHNTEQRFSGIEDRNKSAQGSRFTTKEDKALMKV